MCHDIVKYDRRSIRFQGYDYSLPGVYFVTVCTIGKKCLFGQIIDEKMVLSELGQIAHNIWMEIPLHFHNVMLDEMVVMPNHIHGIITITDARAGHALPSKKPFRMS